MAVSNAVMNLSPVPELPSTVMERARGAAGLVAVDAVALADNAAGAKLLNHQPSDVRHIAIAAGMNLGTMDLDQVDIRRLKLA